MGPSGTLSLFSQTTSGNKQTKQAESAAATVEEEEETSEEVGEEQEAARAKLDSPDERKSLYQLADTGLWWDSFEEEPQFELVDDFESQLTLSEEEDWTGDEGEGGGGGGGGDEGGGGGGGGGGGSSSLT